MHLLTWHSAFIEQHKLSLLRRRLIAGKLQVGAFNFVAGYTATATAKAKKKGERGLLMSWVKVFCITKFMPGFTFK